MSSSKAESIAVLGLNRWARELVENAKKQITGSIDLGGGRIVLHSYRFADGREYFEAVQLHDEYRRPLPKPCLLLADRHQVDIQPSCWKRSELAQFMT